MFGLRTMATSIMVLGAALAGCGGSTTGSPSASTAAGPTTTQAAAPADTSAATTSTVGATTTSAAAGEPDACEKVTLVDIATAFGAPPTLVGHEDKSNPEQCTWSLADGSARGAKVYITLLFPNVTTHNGGASDAVAEIKYNHDFTIQSFPDKVPDIVEAPGVGVYAFFDTRVRTLQVAASPTLAFAVQWVSGGSGDFGTPMSDAVRNSLVKMAALAATDLSN